MLWKYLYSSKGEVYRFITLDEAVLKVYRFITLDEAVLKAGEIEIKILAEAEEYGRQANVAPFMIKELVTSAMGITGVFNDESWLVTEGADQESDDSLRARYILAWKGLSGLNKYFYEHLALIINDSFQMAEFINLEDEQIKKDIFKLTTIDGGQILSIERAEEILNGIAYSVDNK